MQKSSPNASGENLPCQRFTQNTTGVEGDALSSYKRLVGNTEPTKPVLKDWNVKMGEAGLSAFTTNQNIRSFTTFLTWCVENDYTSRNLRLKNSMNHKRYSRRFQTNHSGRYFRGNRKTSTERDGQTRHHLHGRSYFALTE